QGKAFGSSHSSTYCRLLEIEFVKFAVTTAAGDQFLMPSALDDSPRLQDQHEIRVRDGLKVVGDHETGLAGHQPVERLADLRFALHVEAAHRLIQNQDLALAFALPFHRELGLMIAIK